VRSLDVTIVQDEVTGIERDGKLVRSVTVRSAGKLLAGNVVNAAGAWSPIVSEMVAQKLPITPLRRFEHFFECEDAIEPLPYVKDVNRLAFRPEGRGYTGGVPTLAEPRGYNFETDHDYFENVVWPALAHRFPQFESRCPDASIPNARAIDLKSFTRPPLAHPVHRTGMNHRIPLRVGRHHFLRRHP